jgi:adenosylcobyric acid synthase
MLGRTITDPGGVEGSVPTAEGLGLLDLETTFTSEKVLRSHAPAGYEIHHGRVSGSLSAGPVVGTMVHGSLEDDAQRDAFMQAHLGLRAQAAFPAARERRLDLLGDLVEEHLDVSALLSLARTGVPSLPLLPPGAAS